MVVIKITRCCLLRIRKCLGSLASDATGELDVLGHDGHPLCMDGCQVGVLKESDKIGLSRLLKGQHGAGLEAQVSLEILGDLTNQPLERQLPDEQLSGLLVLPDLTESHSSGSVSADSTELSSENSECIQL